MRKILTCLFVCALFIPTPLVQGQSSRPETLQIGLNFIRFYWDDTPYSQPDWIFEDFQALGIQSFRQFPKADLLWNIVEPRDNEWNFDEVDAVLLREDLAYEPVVTLFSMQYSSGTPPWETMQFQKTLGPEARDYLETVIERYGSVVRYWEIGNEMDHWRAADPGVSMPDTGARGPRLAPSDGYSPQEQGVFLAEVAAFIRERDPDAIIVMPGMGGLSDYTLNTWFAGVIEGGGSDWFDIINYHYYSPWPPFGRERLQLQAFIETHGLTDKPVWLTETGTSASPSLTIRTDYPNSPEAQVADIFRRLIQSYGYGDALVMWHCYVGSPDDPNNEWRLYGIRVDDGQTEPSYYALGLFIHELIPFAQVTRISDDPRAANVYQIMTADTVKYVVWGQGEFTVPPGITQMVSVLPQTDGSYLWQSVTPGSAISLNDVPMLMK